MASKVEDLVPKLKKRRRYADTIAWLLLVAHVLALIVQAASHQWIMAGSHAIYGAVLLFWLFVLQPHDRRMEARTEEIRKSTENFREYLQETRREAQQWPNSGTTTESNWKN